MSRQKSSRTAGWNASEEHTLVLAGGVHLQIGADFRGARPSDVEEARGDHGCRRRVEESLVSGRAKTIDGRSGHRSVGAEERAEAREGTERPLQMEGGHSSAGLLTEHVRIGISVGASTVSEATEKREATNRAARPGGREKRDSFDLHVRDQVWKKASTECTDKAPEARSMCRLYSSKRRRQPVGE